MTTPIKQKVNFHSTNNTPCGSSRKAKTSTATNHSNVESMTPSRLNRIHPPKPQETEEQSGGDGEGIQVAIRMRPLNSKEHTHKKVWKVLSKYASVAQTTIEGKPLPERIAGRNFFTYDQTFDESSTTYQVYSAIAQPIVTTACTGRNGTIFAYGQTSSGKTYTMQGSGTIAEGSSENVENGNGGIVHMAAHDIFAHIASCQDRVFVVRASFLEIYNEEVRDLLQDYSNSNKVLQIREDPRRGVFVQSKEMIATDSTSLLAVLWQGEKSRSFATTAMNERSSRSHTIFRITIESRSRLDDSDENDNEDTGSAIRVSTLNLVDLAGSESVRHTGATGDRQKEGGMINQSLLTLSRVIVALGTPNSSHVNFRDSKLTRILQPSLSGNARMAVVCCATPSELYLEETRSTLLFASRAKLVKTNAQINEVLDDRSIIRRLQRELALARSQQHLGGTQNEVGIVEWEKLATLAGTDAKLAKDKLKRLYTTILMNNNLDDTNATMILGVGERRKLDALFPEHKNGGVQEDVDQPPTKRRRRLSDGNLHQFLTSNNFSTPSHGSKQCHPFTDPPNSKNVAKLPIVNTLSPSDELEMMRKVVAAKENKATRFKRQMDHVLKQLQDKDLDLVAANCSNDLLRSDRDVKSALCSTMIIEINDLKSELAATKSAYDVLLLEKETELGRLQAQINDQLEDRRVLEETVDSLQDSKAASERDLASVITEKDSMITTLQEEMESYREQLNHQAKVINVELREQLMNSESERETLTSTIESTSQSLRLASDAKDELAKKNTELVEAIANITDEYSASMIELNRANEALREANHIIEQNSMTLSRLEIVQEDLKVNNSNLNDSVTALLTENATQKEEIVQLKNEKKVGELQFNELKMEYEATQLKEIKLVRLLKDAEIKFFGLLVVLKNNETEMDGMYTRLKQFSAAKKESDILVSQQNTSISDLQSQLSSAINELSNANLHSTQTQELLTAVNIRHDEMCQNLRKSQEDNSMLEQANNKLVELNANAEKCYIDANKKFNHQLESLQHDLDNAVQQESILRAYHARVMLDINNRFDALAVVLHRSELDKIYFANEYNLSIKTNVQMSATIDLLNERIENDEKAFNDRICEQICSERKTTRLLNTYTRSLACYEKKIEGLVVVLKQSQIELEHALTESNFVKAELRSTKVLHQNSCNELVLLAKEIETLKSRTKEYEDTIEQITSERDNALSIATEFQVQLDLTDTNDQAREMEVSRLHQKLGTLEKMREDYEFSLHASERIADRMLTLFEAIDSETKGFILPFNDADKNEKSLVESRNSPLVPMLQTACAKLSHLSKSISVFAASFSNQSDSLSCLEKNIENLEETLLSKENCYTRSIELLEGENKILASEIKQAGMEISNLKKSMETTIAENKQFRLKLSSIESCGCEVDILQSENKELKQLLANANCSIDEARLSAKDIADQLTDKSIALDLVLKQLETKESEIRILTERQSVNQNIEEVRKLTDEKEHLERLLKNELDGRVQFEMEIKRRMSDEQSALIQEAEQAMRGLRMELDLKTNALKRSEAEAYAAREMKDDLEDQCRRTLDRTIQLESQIAALENESTRLRRLSNRQELEYESEIGKLTERLSHANREKQESQMLIRDLKDTVNSTERKLERVSQELSQIRGQLSATSNQELEKKNQQLASEADRLNKEIGVLQTALKGNVTRNDKLKEMEHDNNKLRQKLKSYVDRCEKLESSKLTKDKLEAIKKLMADKAAIEKELKMAKQEIEVHKCVSTGFAQSSTTLEDSEVTKLRFDKEALESKLRKFASQCQQLEDEKLRIILTFKSAKLELKDENIEKAVVALCDKVVSLEQECDSLASYKNKVFSNQVEMTTLQQQKTDLMSKITDLQRKIDNLQWIESGHKNLISSLTEGSTKLQNDVDSKRQEVESVRNQLKYLEQENLQLMIDYKAAKQKIHGLKAELNQLRSQVSIVTLATTRDVEKGSTKKLPKTPNEKENEKGRINRDSEKKHIPLPPSSGVSKVARTSNDERRNPITARLGDAFAASDENTQECKQS